MTHPNPNETDPELETYFRAGRAQVNPASAGLMQRVLADAANVQAGFRPEPAPRSGFWAGLLENIGGWRGASALTACACMGLWIGYTAPVTLADFGVGFATADSLLEIDYSDLDGLQALLTEI